MLHIIGLILKWIGILLLVILGLLVLLVCAVLFAGLRYQLQASCEGTTESLQARLKLNWLFRLVRAEVNVEGKSVRYILKIAWKTLLTSEAEHKTEMETAVKPEETPEVGEITKSEKFLEPEKTPEVEKVPEPGGMPEVEAVSEPEPELKTEQKPAAEEDTERTEESMQQKTAGFLKRLLEKLKAVYQKIKYTFEQICDKIKMLSQKKEMATAFIDDPVHRQAFAKGVTELKRFLKHFRPDKCQADLIFGFSDPYLTGKALAGFGIMYPFLGENVYITPDFEQKILKGHIFLKGHFRISYLLGAVLRMLLHKPTRTTIGHIRRLLR